MKILFIPLCILILSCSETEVSDNLTDNEILQLEGWPYPNEPLLNENNQMPMPIVEESWTNDTELLWMDLEIIPRHLEGPNLELLPMTLDSATDNTLYTNDSYP